MKNQLLLSTVIEKPWKMFEIPLRFTILMALTQTLMYLCMYQVYVCMYLCIYVCMYVCMYDLTYVRLVAPIYGYTLTYQHQQNCRYQFWCRYF